MKEKMTKYKMKMKKKKKKKKATLGGYEGGHGGKFGE